MSYACPLLTISSRRQLAHLDQLPLHQTSCQVLKDWKGVKASATLEEAGDEFGEEFQHWISSAITEDEKRVTKRQQYLVLNCMCHVTSEGITAEAIFSRQGGSSKATRKQHYQQHFSLFVLTSHSTQIETPHW